MHIGQRVSDIRSYLFCQKHLQPVSAYISINMDDFIKTINENDSVDFIEESPDEDLDKVFILFYRSSCVLSCHEPILMLPTTNVYARELCLYVHQNVDKTLKKPKKKNKKKITNVEGDFNDNFNFDEEV